MDIRLQTENEFIPNSFGNKKNSKDKQVVITWKHPTASERNRFRTQYVDENKDLRVKINYDSIIETCVTSIKNLSFNGEKIETGKKLNETPCLSSIVEELSTEILIKINEINSKNF